MSRAPRVTIPEQPHHVITRGNNRRRLFSRDGDYLRFLRYLGEALERTECRLHAVTLMANHVHLLVTPPTKDALAAMVRRFSQRYALARNRSREGSGKLFEQRYVSIPVLDERQLAVTTVYSDVNALRAGLVDDPSAYPWSTYAMHAGEPRRSRIPVEIWRPSSWYLSLGADWAERAASYRLCAVEYVARGEKPEPTPRIEAIEALSMARYGRRLERPNRERAL